MDPRDSVDQLRSSQDHRRAPEDIVSDIENDEYDMANFSISHPYDL